MNAVLSLPGVAGPQAMREVLYASARGALDAHNTGYAQRCFLWLLAVAPLDYRAWYGLASVREELADYRCAANLYEIASRFHPEPAHCHIAQARSWLRSTSLVSERAPAAGMLDKAENATDEPYLHAVIARLRSQL